MTRLSALGLTDPGLARRHNEDFFAIDAERRLYVVADGMGGHSHGEVASRITVETICAYVRGNDGGVDSPAADGAQLRNHSKLLRSAIFSAQDQVLGAIEEDLALRGMGTTVVSLYVDNGVGAVAHVGDSRVYRLRDGRLQLLTRDHTWVNEQVEAGFLSAEQARTHPLRNVVTRALGGESEVEVEVQEVKIEDGDRYLLCSDGLTGMLRDEEITTLLTSDDDLEAICKNLIAAANDHGGSDNITVVLVAADG